MEDQLVRENIASSSLSDRDQYLWRLEAIAHLQARDFQNLDVEHLLEEIEILAGRDWAEVESHFREEYFLKLNYLVQGQ